MPIKRRETTTKVNRVSGSASRLRFIEIDAEGHTAEFNDLIDKTSKASKAELSPNQVADPFSYVTSTTLPAASLQPINPVYSFEQLASIVQKSNSVRQCIESYVVNIESYGHTLEYIGPEGKEHKPAVQAEKAALESFLSNCSPELTLREVRERSRVDHETLGVRFFELARDRAGRCVLMDHIPGMTMRRTRRDVEPTEIIIEVANPADPSLTIRKTATRNFCRFVQLSYGAGGWDRVYFKEFGDPRPISPKTGLVDFDLPISEQATEVLMLSQYTPGYIYGLPRWFSQLPAILGSREAELVNLNFFRENAIPAMAVLVSGGALTTESFQAVEEYLTAIRGQKSMNRMLVLEAQADDSGGSIDKGLGSIRVDIKPMAGDRQQDGLFDKYDQANQQKVRSSFRLPPIFAGRAEDYTRASAFASMFTAEQQIFGPERTSFDDLMNFKVLRTYKPKYWRFKSGGIPIVDPDAMGTMIQALDDTGALTPNAVIKIANRVLSVEIEPITEDWGDFPFQAVMQYINQGKTIPGLTEFIVDLEAEAEAAANEAKNAASPSQGTLPTTNDKKNKPVNNNDSKAKTKKSEDTSLPMLRQVIRKELRTITRELRDTITAAVQVTAPN